MCISDRSGRIACREKLKCMFDVLKDAENVYRISSAQLYMSFNLRIFSSRPYVIFP